METLLEDIPGFSSGAMDLEIEVRGRLHVAGRHSLDVLHPPIPLDRGLSPFDMAAFPPGRPGKRGRGQAVFRESAHAAGVDPF